MKEIVKTFVIAVVTVVAIFAFTITAFKAWDAQYEVELRKDFEIRYEHHWEFDDEYLESVRARMPEGFQFADWGYPEFDEGDK